MSAFAAFWPPDFFNNNLANLDQLSFWFPFIMLVFIPTITMSIWADERQAGDRRAAADDSGRRFRHRAGQVPGRRGHLHRVAAVLAGLQLPRAEQSRQHDAGSPDAATRFGLFLGTYVGYWLVGLAMLAIGMVASFLTGNLTIGFILGVLFNVPLVFAVCADAIFGTAARPLADQAVEHRRAVPRLRPRRADPLRRRLFR